MQKNGFHENVSYNSFALSPRYSELGSDGHTALFLHLFWKNSYVYMFIIHCKLEMKIIST